MRRSHSRPLRADGETLVDVGGRTLGHLSEHEVLQGAAEAARSLVDADLVAISLQEGGVVAVAGHRSRALELARTAEPDIVRRVTELSGPVHVHWDLGQGEPAGDPEAVQATQEDGVRTSVALPLLRGATTIGILWAHSRERRDFTIGEVSLLQGIAAEVALAISNTPEDIRANGSAGLPGAEPAALQERQRSKALPAETAATQAKQQLEALLTAAGQLNAAKETEEVMRCVVAIGAKLLKAQRAGIATDEAGATTRRYAVVDGAHSGEESALDAELTLAGRVFKRARPFRARGRQRWRFPSSGLTARCRQVSTSSTATMTSPSALTMSALPRALPGMPRLRSNARNW